MTHPLQTMEKIFMAKHEPRKELVLDFELAPNEFTAKDNSIGFLAAVPEPQNFLSIEKEYRTKTDIGLINGDE